LLIALFITAGPPVLICLVIHGYALVALFIGILMAGQRQWSGVKSIILKATPVSIHDFSPQLKLVRVTGEISQIRELLDSQDPTLAMLKVQINGWKHAYHEYGGVWGKTKATPFLINAGTGSLWIDPRPIDSRQLGDGTQLDYEQIRRPCQILGVDVDKVTPGTSDLSCLIWEWRVGQRLTIFGKLQRNNGEWTITRLRGQPMIVSPLEFNELTKTTEKNASRFQGVSWGIIVLIIVLLGCPAMGLCGWLLRIIMSSK
jgi:hypothetical protein